MTSIKEFLLSRALQDEAEADARRGEPQAPGEPGTTAQRRTASRHTALRAEIELHNDRTMTVTSRSGTVVITRCGTCPQEPTRPCRALRHLAQRYADHPSYLPEWRLS